jgi:hypothetical protein
MARVKVERIVEHLSQEMGQALAEAMPQTPGGPQADPHELFRRFKRAVSRNCKTWEKVPDKFVDLD